MRLNRKSSVKSLLSGGDRQDPLWLFVKQKYDDGLELRRPYQRLWMVNLAFLSGRQYTFFNKSAEILQEVAARKGRIRVVDNKILPRYRKQVSRLIRNRPKMSVVPSTSELEDIEAAKVGNKVLESFWRNDKMQQKLRQLGGWIYSCGNGYLDDRWNPRTGPAKFDPKQGKVIYEGDAEVGVWSPLEILVPAVGIGNTDLHKFPWIIKHKYRLLEYFTHQYGTKVNVAPESVGGDLVDASVVYGTSVSADTSKLPGAMEIQLYLQPCDEYPKGLYVVGANGTILAKQDYPYDYYHLEHFRDIEIPGVYYGMATLEPAIWLQKLWNRSLSDLAEFNRTMGKGKWMAPLGANLQTVPDDSMGQILYYTPKMGIKPEHVAIRSLPPTYQEVMSLVANGLMELFYQHEVTQGTNRSDIRSGEMVQLLLEQDDYGNIPTHAVFEEGLEAVMQRVLRRIQKGYTSERTMQIRGKGGEYEVFSFKGSDLRSNTNVHVKKESSLPDSKVGRQNQILVRYEKGLYGDPANPEIRRQVLNMLEDAVTENVFGDVYLDEQIARIENRTMATSPTRYLVNAYDNHQVHVAEHNRFRKSQKYQGLKNAKDMKRRRLFYYLEAVFQDHVNQHMQFIEAARQRQLKEMAIAKGGR